MLLEPAAVVAAVLLAALATFQGALALGAPWGAAAYGGAHTVLPARLRIASALSLPLIAGTALALLRRAGLIAWAPLPDAWLTVALWVVAALLVVSCVLNAISRSRTERATGLPVALLLLAAVLVVQTSAPSTPTS